MIGFLIFGKAVKQKVDLLHIFEIASATMKEGSVRETSCQKHGLLASLSRPGLNHYYLVSHLTDECPPLTGWGPSVPPCDHRIP